MGVLNVPNRTLYHGDNLDFMRALNSESIDLIATDPPFNKGRDFHAGSEDSRFRDRWSWGDDERYGGWSEQIQRDCPSLWSVIETAKVAHSLSMGAFLCSLAIRVLEMYRLLKSTGSLYLHCDHTASAYIRIMLDAIFGKKNFRNEIVWCYTRMSARGQKVLSRAHDSIFWYSKSDDWVFNVDEIRLPYAKGSRDREGRTLNRLGSGVSKEGKTVLNPLGKFPEDWIVHIPYLRGKERIGYPTQKPLKLYERIILASSNECDVVFDPYCGCATTLVAAEKLGRQWVGCDIWEKVYQAVIVRLYGQGLSRDDIDYKSSFDKLVRDLDIERLSNMWFRELGINYLESSRLPVRTDDDGESL